MELIITSDGEIARAIQKHCDQIGQKWRPWTPGVAIPEDVDLSNLVVVHLGSGAYLGEIIGFCEAHGIILVQGSKGMESLMPQRPRCPIFNLPNFVPPVAQFTYLLGVVANELHQVGVEPRKVLASCPQDKPEMTLTTLQMAQAVRLAVTDVHVILHKREQLRRGVAAEFLDCHEHQSVVFHGAGVKVTMGLEIDGLDAYAIGMIQVCRLAREKIWPSGVHGIRDILDNLEPS